MPDLWIAQGVGGSAAEAVKKADLALLRRPALKAFADFDDAWRQPSGRDSNVIVGGLARVKSIRDRFNGALFDAHGSLAANGQYAAMADGQYGLQMGGNTGAKVSADDRWVVGADWTEACLYKQTAGLDGYGVSTMDTSGFIALGLTNTNIMRFYYGGGNIDVAAAVNNGSTVQFLIASHVAASNTLRLWHQGVRRYNAVRALGSITDLRMMVGGLPAAGATITGGVDGPYHSAIMLHEAGDDGDDVIEFVKDWADAHFPSAGFPH